MDRILQSQPVTIQATFYDQDGIIVDPGTVTVAIARADGTAVTAGNATGTGAAVRQHALTADDTALLDRLTATWVSTTAGIVVTHVEVVGDFLFTIAEAREISSLADPAEYATSDIKQMRSTVEQALEETCGAFVPRYELETVSGNGTTQPLALTRPLVRHIRSIIVDGVAFTSDDLAAVTSDGSFLYGPAWSKGSQNIVIGYEHGRDYPPERVRRAALLLAKVWLTAGPIDDRTSTFTSADGGTFALVTPGRGGSMFGVPEVDAVVQQYDMPRV